MKSASINNLKQIGLAFQTANGDFHMIPHNGGADTVEEHEAVNFGWHSPKIKGSGTWATFILPYMEQDPLFRNTEFEGVEQPELPKFPDDKFWQVTVRNYHCSYRGRNGYSTADDNGAIPGIVTDYALNVFLNAPPKTYTSIGLATASKDHPVVGDWASKNNRYTLQGIQDGSSNTILVGQKALPVLKAGDVLRGGDEGIFSPGNYRITREGRTLNSTGTARGHVVVKEPVEAKEYADGVPWMVQDKDVTEKTKWPVMWGGPFNSGVLFGMGDGTVRTINYNQRGTANFARMLYPSDGAVVVFD